MQLAVPHMAAKCMGMHLRRFCMELVQSEYNKNQLPKRINYPKELVHFLRLFYTLEG